MLEKRAKKEGNPARAEKTPRAEDLRVPEGVTKATGNTAAMEAPERKAMIPPIPPISAPFPDYSGQEMRVQPAPTEPSVTAVVVQAAAAGVRKTQRRINTAAAVEAAAARAAAQEPAVTAVERVVRPSQQPCSAPTAYPFRTPC